MSLLPVTVLYSRARRVVVLSATRQYGDQTERGGTEDVPHSRGEAEVRGETGDGRGGTRGGSVPVRRICLLHMCQRGVGCGSVRALRSVCGLTCGMQPVRWPPSRCVHTDPANHSDS